ncbi:DUF1501 domain-containing protein [Fimbriiglobus ruber]|nr:DUF1501 domain-containing protein [Fimbriiglobus ruber]
MNPRLASIQAQTRRQFLGAGSSGLGAVALASLLGDTSSARADRAPAVDDPLAPRKPHFPAKAKRVIYLHMSGSPPHLDLFDYKPELVKRTGQDVPDSFLKGRRFAFTSGVPKLLGTPRKYEKRGKGGVWMSDAVPKLHEVADEICMIKSMKTDEFNHAPAELLLFTGSARQGRPGMGSWVTYGLGTENQNLPGFVVLISSGVQPSGGANDWGNGFLPSVFQGVQCRTKGDPVLYVSDPAGMDRGMRKKTIDALHDLNDLQAGELGHPETQTRIAQYELAFRMQTAVPEVMDITKETKQTIEDYGASPGGASFANNCLLARRLVQKGVRFVQLFDWGWDFHGTGPGEDIRDGLTKKCATMDKPIAALIRDLKRLGMLDDTLIVWTGEFGRTPFREGRTAGGSVLGRDHYPDCYCAWMAGAGVKHGYSHGETDDLGFSVAKDLVHVHDFQATLMHLLGFDHTKLTYRFQGRDYRLTDVHGHVVKDVLA